PSRSPMRWPASSPTTRAGATSSRAAGAACPPSRGRPSRCRSSPRSTACGRSARADAMAREPRISIVTPAGGEGAALRRPLASVDAQEPGDVEHLVVGAGAIAGSRRARVVAGPAAPRGAAINAGFRAANGAIFGTLDPGDVLLPGALARVAREVD